MKKLAVLVFAMAFVGCAKGQNTSVKAPAAIGASFAVADIVSGVVPLPMPESSFKMNSPTEKARISIAKTSLDKEFLLQSNLLVGLVAPQFENLKSRIVAFKKEGNRLLMLEATQGHRITNDIEMPLLLTDFAILAEDETHITFDFNEGMSRIFVAGDLYAQDVSGSSYKATFSAVKTRYSYIDKAKLNESKNQLAISQVAQMGVISNGLEDNQTVRVNYYLSPYLPDGKFESVRSRDKKLMGFFEVMPQTLTTGGTVVFASKFDVKKPVVYAVSANTPESFKQAVREGILYWNKAFGREVVKVVDAPEKVTAPDVDFNIVQWINWNNAGFAYADAQMDPRTGEILHAQVYLTSTFAVSSKSEVRALLKRLTRQNGEATETKGKTTVSLAGFHKGHLCDLDLDEAMNHSVGAMSALTGPNVDDAKILKASQDYVRSIVAHEVGHTLGLRHNFAGSLAINYPLSKKEELFSNYMRDGEIAKDVVASSTVMDYLSLEDELFVGDFALRGTTALEYDTKAIGALYAGKKYKTAEMPAFCTDTQLKTYLDCRQWDTGGSYIEYATWLTRRQTEGLAFQLMNEFIRLAKDPSPGAEVVDVETIRVSADMLAAFLLSSRYELYKTLTVDARILKVEREFAFVSEVNKDEVALAREEYLKGEFAKVGGVAKAFEMLPEDYTSRTFAQLVTLFDDPAFTKGTDSQGKSYEFTREELARLRVNSYALFEKLKHSLVKEDLKLMLAQGAGKLATGQLGDDLIPVLDARVARYVFSTDPGKEIIAEVAVTKDKKVTLVLPKFVYPHDLRATAAGLMRSNRSEAFDWGIYEPSRKKSFEQLLEKALGGTSISTFKIEEMPRPVGRWLVENKSVFYSF